MTEYVNRTLRENGYTYTDAAAFKKHYKKFTAYAKPESVIKDNSQ